MKHRAVPVVAFAVERRDQGTTRTIAPRGELDLASAPQARAAVHDALEGPVETLVVDLANVTFLDSTGIHLLLAAETDARARGVRFALLPGPPAVQRILAMVGVETAPGAGASAGAEAGA